MKANIYIGAAGWSYTEWLGKFYPQDMNSQVFLSYYLRHFNTVEINSSFYHLPLRKTLRRWHDSTPPDFLFAVKASRFITHLKRLSEPQQSVQKFFEIITSLKKKTGPILFQLPPRWKSNPERLSALMKVLPKQYRYTFELRDPNWFNDDIYNILKEHNAAFCIYDFDKNMSPKIVSADFVYVRFHGPDRKYVGSYSDDFLKQWANDFQEWQRQGKDVYCYFDNTADGAAVKNAQYLKDFLSTTSEASKFSLAV